MRTTINHDGDLIEMASNSPTAFAPQTSSMLIPTASAAAAGECSDAD
jgi:hypothetical protein